MELDGLVKAGVRRAPLVRRFVLAAHEAHLHDFNCFFFFFGRGVQNIVRLFLILV